ncbi:MAG: hypothetical protein RNU03_02615 [Candidatus Sedimenticola sp. (ex Thyasira tokunagai)]
MNRHISKKITLSLLFILLTFLAGTAPADDTEIYFSSGSSVGNTDTLKSNVLFILDTSGSMSNTVPGTSDSRIATLKTVMRQVINDVQDVNLGLMRFTGYDGGPVLFPIADVDARASSVVGEPADSNPSYSNRITDGTNDAEELSGGSVNTGDSSLDMVVFPGSSGGASITMQVDDDSDDAREVNDISSTDDGTLLIKKDRWIAVRFSGVNIPQGATINSANLQFVVRKKKTSETWASIWGQYIDSAATFSGIDSDISSRIRTSTQVDWKIPGFNKNSTVTTPDIKTLVKTIVDRPGWTAGSSMVFLLKEKDSSGSADRRFFAHDKSSSKAPKLNISYDTPSIPSSSQTVALRFEEIQIPQGATITKANLVFVPKTTESGTANLTFKAEAADNSLPIFSTDNNISNRSTTVNSALWSNVPTWSSDTSTNTPENINLKSVIQEVTGRTNWCGGNALTIIVSGDGLRTAKSVEASAAEAAQLNYTYQAGNANGCFNKSDNPQIGSSRDDAEEDTNDGSMTRSSSKLNLGDKNVGLRFQNVDVPQGATIIEAELSMTAATASSGAASTTIKGQAADNTDQFSSNDDDISDRVLNSSSIIWNHDDWVVNESYASPDIATVIQDIVNRGGWNSGNSMTLVLTPNSGSDRAAYSNDGDAARGARLRIKYASTGGSGYKTVRERLLEIVDDLPDRGNTPIVEVMDEAARYWRGDDVKYGLKRKTTDSGSYNYTARISHPGSYCDAGDSCNGANTTSYSPYGINRPSGCPSSDSNDPDCSEEKIEGTPSYISPFSSTLTCQSNFQVLLTDGQANSLSSGVQAHIEADYLGGTSCLSTNGANNSYASSERCGVDIAKFLFEEDQNSTLDNDQTVRTYTIAFNLNDAGATQFLKDMARDGNGGTEDTGFYSATSADDLLNAFTSILLEVKRDPTSIASPSLATNAFNRLLSRDEIFFGLFTPSLEARWDGNLKKYKVCTDTSQSCTFGTIIDSSGSAAIDTVSSKFRDSSKSFWSDLVDGKATTEGGSGAEMSDYTDRIIYTDTTAAGTAPTTGTSLGDSGYKLTSTNWNSTALAQVRSLVCPTPSTSAGSDCEDRMLFILGKKITSSPETDINTTTRWAFNDVLHSSPVVITYGGADSDSDGIIDTYYDKIIVGTNDGSLRLINGATGKEEWAFVPEELLSNQSQLFTNPEADHVYGLDLTPQIHTKDVDLDGVIEPADGDLVYAYIGMRRGGSTLYALDLTASVASNTTVVVPKFLWRIEGGTGTFSRMGQSWSKPQLAEIKVNGSKTTVLIFAGGYDTALDGGFGTTPTSGNDNKGNAVYIVNATTGQKIISISGTDSGADIEVAAMHYSIASNVTVFDSDGNGYDDRIYVTDTGGQVLRVDLGIDLNVDSPGDTVVGQLASLSTAGTVADERRFFEPAAVVQVKDSQYSNATGGQYDYVLVGSGYRSHPLVSNIQDRFYALRDEQTIPMLDSNNDHLADNYPLGANPLYNSDLVDLTNSILDSSSDTHKAASGWYITLAAGEKMLAEPIVLAGGAYFTTYNPDATAGTDLCSVNIGRGRAYAVNILDASEAIDWNDNGIYDIDLADTNAIDERSKDVGGGIPSAVVPVFTKEGVIGIVGTESGATTLDTVIDLPQHRTYWYDE